MGKKPPKRVAWVITWRRSNTSETPNMPATSPGVPLAVFPHNASKSTIEGALVGIHQAFASEYAVDMMPYVTRTAPYMPQWNWKQTHCSIGHDPEILAYRVHDLELDVSANGGAGKFSWSITPAGPRPKLSY